MSVVVPVAPICEPTEATAGSFWITPITASMRPSIAGKEMLWAASAIAMIIPVSCYGKKPLGMITYRYPVTPIVPSMTISVMKRWRSAILRLRS